MKRFLLLILAVAGLFCLVPTKADAGVTVAVGPGYGPYYGPAYYPYWYGGLGWRGPHWGCLGGGGGWRRGGGGGGGGGGGWGRGVDRSIFFFFFFCWFCPRVCIT